MSKRFAEADRDNPAWREADFKRAHPAMDALPAETVAVLPRRRGQRGPQRRPTKQQVSLRIDRDVLARFRASGPGWHGRINQVLKNAVAGARERPARKYR